jgi:hypothetical protein
VAYGPDFGLAPGDWAVLPEQSAFTLARQIRGVRKVIYNQNAYYTFANSSFSLADSYCPYLDSEVKATIAISDDSARYFAHVFPAAKIFRHFYDYDPDTNLEFVPQAEKHQRISFMPRKNFDHASQVLQILRFRNALADWEIQTIDDMTSAAVADALKKSAVFLSFGYPEGCPFPPAEAMLCGCIVIGYHGNGGREYFTAEHGFPVDLGQIIDFARVAESVLSSWTRQKAAFSQMCRKAHDYIRTTYNAQRERISMQQIWAEIFSAG